MSEPNVERACRIEQALGRSEACPGTACPFWEPGDGIRPGSCIFEQLDLGGRAALAGWLHDLREQLGDPAGLAR